MPQYRVTSPDGKVYEVTAPEGATQEDAIAHVQSQLAAQPQPVEPGPRQSQPEQAGLGTRLLQSVTDAGKATFHGGTAGFGDEITGAALAPVFAAANAIKGEPFDLKRDYETGRAAYNRQLNDYRERHPVASTVAEVGGGITTAAYTPGLRAMAAAPAASATARIAGNMKQGATAGAVYGAGEGGSIQDRAEGAILGGVVGAGTGMVATPIVDGVSVVLRNLANMTVNRAGQTAQTTVAARKAAEALLRDGLTPEQATVKIAQMGPEAALMDVGVNSRRLAGSISRLPGQGSQTLDDFVRVRQEGARGSDGVLRGGQTSRIGQNIDDMVPGRFDANARASLVEQRRTAGNPLYRDTANNADNLIPEEKIGDLLGDSYIAGVIRNVQDDPLYNLGGTPPNSLKVVDRALKQLDDEMQSAFRAGQGNRGNALRERFQALRERAVEAYPQYGQARDVWREFSGVIDAGDLGRKFMTGNQAGRADDLAAAVKRMDPGELEQLRRGAAEAIRDKLGGLNARSDATKKLYNIPALEQKTRVVFGDDETFRRYVQMLDNEAEMFKGYAEITGGSPTAQRMAADLDTNMDPGALAESAVDISANPMNIAAWLRAGNRLAGDAANRVRMPEAQRTTLAELLAGRDATPLYQRLVAEQAAAGGRQRLAEHLARGGAISAAPR